MRDGGPACLLGEPAGRPCYPAQAPYPPAAASPALTPDEQLFTGLVEQVGAAIEKRDMAALGKYLAPDYVYYNPGNGHSDRAEELAYLATWPTISTKLVSP
ncbi:MAG: nuclear transport factor 2 family protein [Hymenobacter sp.]